MWPESPFIPPMSNDTVNSVKHFVPDMPLVNKCQDSDSDNYHVSNIHTLHRKSCNVKYGFAPLAAGQCKPN